ncbi:MAG TPA: glycosyltransferase family 2 protein [Bacteroidota bacterium]|nr:glycosyltransferase family 2 protein [Bacteroidota bacterium]
MPPLRISIVTPSLNQSEFLEENILSILRQNDPAFEHIVIDAVSTDDTGEILKRYPHLRWVSEPDSGQSAALNKGLRMAAGEIIGWLNADDCYCAGAFERVRELFSKDETMVVYGDGREINHHGEAMGKIIPRGISAKEFIYYWRWKYSYCQPSFFFRRTALERIGYLDESLHYVMDHDVLIRLILLYPFVYVPQCFSSFRVHPESKTSKSLRFMIPSSVWELHRVSRRYWGKTDRAPYFSTVWSFVGAIALSFFKNIFLVRGSKLQDATRRIVRSKK